MVCLSPFPCRFLLNWSQHTENHAGWSGKVNKSDTYSNRIRCRCRCRLNPGLGGKKIKKTILDRARIHLRPHPYTLGFPNLLMLIGELPPTHPQVKQEGSTPPCLYRSGVLRQEAQGGRIVGKAKLSNTLC